MQLNIIALKNAVLYAFRYSEKTARVDHSLQGEEYLGKHQNTNASIWSSRIGP